MRTFLSGNLNYSSWSIRALLVARHAGLEADEEIIPLDMPDTVERISAFSPTRKVPLLVWDDETIWDSLAIIEWLDERFPGKVWPEDAKARARARAISAEMHSGFPVLRKMCPMDIRARHATPELTDALKADIARVDRIWTETRDAFGGGGDYLFGEWSAADAVYAPVVTRFRTYDLPHGDTARMYMDAVFRHPLMIELEKQAAAEPWTIVYGPDGSRGSLKP